jgi:NTP pyrophosphatase (non-canonical NTP hydrolase)
MSNFKLNDLSNNIHKQNVKKGFYEDYEDIKNAIYRSGDDQLIPAFEQTFSAQRYALIHSEATEALEAMRSNKLLDDRINGEWKEGLLKDDDKTFQGLFQHMVKDTQEDELADVLIRVLDYAAFKGIDLDFHVEAKLRYNALRPHKHNKLI